MTLFDQWDIPSINKGWGRYNNNNKFDLYIHFDSGGAIQDCLKKIPDGTTTLFIHLPSLFFYRKERKIVFEKDFIPDTVTFLNVIDKNGHTQNVVLQDGDWIPSSVTMLWIPALPAPLSLIPDSVKYLRLNNQNSPVKIDMVPPTVEYLFINHTHSHPTHDIPSTVKELVLIIKSLRYSLPVKPTFTSPIHIGYVYEPHPFREDGIVNFNFNIQSITFPQEKISTSLAALPPTITSLAIHDKSKLESDDCLSTLLPDLPPQIKYLSLPPTYQQPIYQNQHLPINITHLEITIIVEDCDTQITNLWLSRKGYLPPSITHIKFSILDHEKHFNSKREEIYYSSPTTMEIVIPSTIQSVCIEPDLEVYRQHISIIDKDDYYSTTPKTPTIREGLKELVLPKSFNHHIQNNSLPSTLESLSILNPMYKKTLNGDNLPTTLTSFTCKIEAIRLDLSAYSEIKQLKIQGNSVTNYPPNVESLNIKIYDLDPCRFNFVNEHLIKNLSVYCSTQDDSLGRLLDIGFPNLAYFKTNSLNFKVPATVQELCIKDVEDQFDCYERYLSPNIKDIHIGLSIDTLRSVSIPVEMSPRKGNYLPTQLQMKDSFFKIWRNIYIKSLIMESLYDLIKSPLSLKYKNGKLNHLDRFPNYNLFVHDKRQLVPALLLYDKADQMNISFKQDSNLSELVPKSIKKLKCTSGVGEIPNWITHLDLGKWNHLCAENIPLSVTSLRLCSKFGQESNLCKVIPVSVKYLTLDRLKSNCIPPSITYPCLFDQPINTLDPSFIPDTIEKIEFKRFVVNKKKNSQYVIPPSVACRLVNGVFYVYSKEENNTTIPLNTTHLFWLDDQNINNGDLNIPSSVHTLVLGAGFKSHIISLPPTITQMEFRGAFRQPLNAICFPPALKFLRFTFVDDVIEQHDLPKGLTHLAIEDKGQIKSLPLSVHHLELSANVYEGLVIPPQVQHLKVLGSTGIHIPPTIKSITTSSLVNISFDKEASYNTVAPREPEKRSPFNSDTNIHFHSSTVRFNSIIAPYTLGNNIKSISFGNSFNRMILPGTFPNSIEHLDFGNEFNQPLHNSLLPTSLLTLVLGSQFDQDLKDVFPLTLTGLYFNKYIKMDSKAMIKSRSQFPPHLKKLVTPYYEGLLDILPTTINHLKLVTPYYQGLSYNLPTSINHLKLKLSKARSYIFPIHLVPPHITTLGLSDYLMRLQSYDHIPLTIKKIKLCNSLTPGTKIPITVESVVLPSSFNKPLCTILQTNQDDDLK
ncbi:hypothetical protein CYY_008876 [Polysphondylium violaceum]|uniref:FNIP repeat-containing protein n=1 Tax=Polysphondylium violaceum TaxID=133409 RepID=A0A8J4PL16_9MYCE|nr:hypothetical protein CYY_008876 [Polysphondylium violaceum]